jgi:hypothetical protein
VARPRFAISMDVDYPALAAFLRQPT